MNSYLPASAFVLIVWAAATLLLWESGAILIAVLKTRRWHRYSARVVDLGRVGKTREDRNLKGEAINVTSYHRMWAEFEYSVADGSATGGACNPVDFGFIGQNYDPEQFRQLMQCKETGHSITIWADGLIGGGSIVFRKVPSKMQLALGAGLALSVGLIFAGSMGWLDTELAGSAPMLNVPIVAIGVLFGSLLALILRSAARRLKQRSKANW